MNPFADWLRREYFSGWTRFEYLWLGFCVASITGLSLYLGDTAAGVISAVTGTLYTLFAGKGKVSCYAFGIVNTVLYGWISCQNRLFGEVMLNWGWYLPMMFVGVFCWKRNLDREQTIVKTALTARGRITAAFATLAGVIVYAFILNKMGDQQPIVDSITTILSVTAMVFTVKRCIEQWVLWTAVNTISIWMWLRVYLADGGNAAVLIMWCIALANGILFYIQWKREAIRRKRAEERKMSACPMA